MTYHPMPLGKRANGKPRHIGFELEFTGIDFESAASALQSCVQGELNKDSAVEWSLNSEELGRINIELDWNALKKTADNGKSEQEWIALLRDSAALIVPLEVVLPPLTFEQLPRCDGITDNLRQAGARGTDDSLIAAFGVHINTELPDLSLNTLLRYLRAFSLLQWWLVEAHKVDLTRRISPYVDLFPQGYVRRLLSKTPADRDELIDDYLADNATRNRAFDMLPVFSCLDAARVKQSIDDDRIKARETFHYRLPNCSIDRTDWQLSQPWNIWLVVEKLANDPEALETLSQSYLEQHRPLLGVNRKQWVQKLTQWMQDREWV